jgi:protein-S-isoprenylcysteine O-methyltransferase Ste14
VTSTPVQPSLAVRVGKVFFRYRDALFPLVLIPLFVLFPLGYPGGSASLDFWMHLVGLVVALKGQVLRAAVIGYVYILRGGRDRQVYAEDLVTSGFFAHARNPLYLGNILILVGLFLIHGNPWVIALGSALFLTVYVCIVAAEEAYLSERFGEQYAEYARRVPRWIPHIRGLGATVAGMRFNWKRVVAKEYSSTAVWMGGAVLLLMQQARLRHGYTLFARELVPGWVALAVLLVAWGGARFLKKTGRLKGG